MTRPPSIYDLPPAIRRQLLEQNGEVSPTPQKPTKSSTLARGVQKQGEQYRESQSATPEAYNGSQRVGKGKQVEWRWGRLGDTSHLWGYRAKANCSGYISKCGRVQRNHEPDGSTVNPCVLCMGEGEEG